MFAYGLSSSPIVVTQCEPCVFSLLSGILENLPESFEIVANISALWTILLLDFSCQTHNANDDSTNKENNHASHYQNQPNNRQ